MDHLTAAALEAGVGQIRQSPRDLGRVELIVCRPGPAQREVLAEAQLDVAGGLVGDTWQVRRRKGPDSVADLDPDPGSQITVMNSRVASLVASADDRRPLAGDQLYVDLDLSHDNLPAGSRLALGSAVIEVSDRPHLGCRKFSDRFGSDALSFVRSPLGRRLRLRGLKAMVIAAGTVRVGDTIRKH